MHKILFKDDLAPIECACCDCDNTATHVWGGRPHCEDCMPPMYKLGKHKDFIFGESQS